MVEADHIVRKPQRQTMPNAKRLNVCAWRSGSKPSVEPERK